jgi:CHASE2 domain-containing sensor protein
LVLVSFVLVIALLVGLIRLCNVYFFAGHEWITYAAVGALSVIAGLIIWRRRRPVSLRK